MQMMKHLMHLLPTVKNALLISIINLEANAQDALVIVELVYHNLNIIKYPAEISAHLALMVMLI